MPIEKDLPRTIERSSAKARRTYAKTHEAAVRKYGEGERAHRVAIASLKHSFEKVGDRWVAKDKKGPSDPRDAQRRPDRSKRPATSYGGVDYYGSTKEELYERARKLEIKGRSRMSKKELARAISRRQG